CEHHLHARAPEKLPPPPTCSTRLPYTTLFRSLYVSVNAVTQACMSFTSQNYSVGKQKRMDRVLLDCMVLSAGVAGVLGVGAYVRSEEHTSELQSRFELVCRPLLEKKTTCSYRE